MPMIHSLGLADGAVLIAFFAVIVVITILTSRRATSTQGYFLANRSAQGWVLGLSFVSMSASSISFLAFPAAAYEGNWGGLIPFLVMPLVAVLADWIFLPLYRRIHITSGYEYLERRFGPFARLYGSSMFLLLQIGRVGLILVLMSLPLTLLTGMEQTTVIALCGVFTTTYVLFGGLATVLWTEVMQTIVLLVSLVFCVGLILWQLPGGMGEVLSVGYAADKFAFPPWHIAGASPMADFCQLTFLVLFLHGVFNQLLYYGADQNVIQRYLAAGSSRAARQGLWIGSFGVIPLFLILMFLGTALFVYYKRFPDPAIEQLSPDQVFPYFILTRLPPGAVGLTIAGLLAAAMSTLVSNLNAISAVFQIDIYRRYLVVAQSDAHYLRAAKIITLAGGAIITLGALALTQASTNTLLELVFLVYAIFAGGLAGLFLLGMLSRRANATGATAGIAASVVVSLYLTCSHFGWLLPEWLRSPTHPYLIGAFANMALLLVGYGVSLCLSPGNKSELGDEQQSVPSPLGEVSEQGPSDCLCNSRVSQPESITASNGDTPGTPDADPCCPHPRPLSHRERGDFPDGL